MKIRFAFAMLLTFCGLGAFADDVTWETPVADGSYYLYNVGQGKYLTVSNGAFTLSSTDGTLFTLSSTATSNTFTLTSTDGVLYTSFNAPLNLSSSVIGMGEYDEFKFNVVDADNHTYKIGCLEEDAFSYSQLYYSNSTNAVGMISLLSDDNNGLWKFTSTDPSAEPVVLRTAITLDEEDEECDLTNLAESVDVTITKTLLVNKRNSICFPFKMTAAQVKAAFGSGTKIYEFEKIVGSSIYYTITTAVRAGEPCMIEPKQVAEDNTYEIKGVSSSNFMVEPNDVKHGSYIMHGTYVMDNQSNFYNYYNGKLTHFSSARDINAFTSFLQPTTSSAAKLTNVVEYDEEVDGISNVTFEYSDATPIYNVNGQMVRRSSTSTDGLTPGIYVINGKKVLVK